MDAKTIRVHAPTAVLFVCGGQYDVTSALPRSLRDAFLRIHYATKPPRYDVLIAEDLNAFFPQGQYQDILSFEADIAQISELILLFSESYGSAAELRAFSMMREIGLRLLVIIDDHNYTQQSFITLGPIRALINAFGDHAVCVLNRSDIGIPDISNPGSVNLAILQQRLDQAIKTREIQTREHTTFDPNRAGHIIKLMVGLIQHYGALTVNELDILLYCMNIDSPIREHIDNLLLCAQFAKRIVRDKRGLSTYFISSVSKEAIQYKLKGDIGFMDKERWKADIIEYWRETDPDRFSSIKSALVRSSK